MESYSLTIMLVVLFIWIGIAFFLIRIDIKLIKLEKVLKEIFNEDKLDA